MKRTVTLKKILYFSSLSIVWKFIQKNQLKIQLQSWFQV